PATTARWWPTSPSVATPCSPCPPPSTTFLFSMCWGRAARASRSSSPSRASTAAPCPCCPFAWADRPRGVFPSRVTRAGYPVSELGIPALETRAHGHEDPNLFLKATRSLSTLVPVAAAPPLRSARRDESVETSAGPHHHCRRGRERRPGRRRRFPVQPERARVPQPGLREGRGRKRHRRGDLEGRHHRLPHRRAPVQLPDHRPRPHDHAVQQRAHPDPGPPAAPARPPVRP